MVVGCVDVALFTCLTLLLVRFRVNIGRQMSFSITVQQQRSVPWLAARDRASTGESKHSTTRPASQLFAHVIIYLDYLHTHNKLAVKLSITA